MSTQVNERRDAVLIPFNEYTVFYYSQSSNPWEAAYINCFHKVGNDSPKHVGYMVFTYDDGTVPPGQENGDANYLPTKIPFGQQNHLEPERGYDFFVLYYSLSRFDDVINLLRNAVAQDGSMMASCDNLNHIWALCNNLHVPVGE